MPRNRKPASLRSNRETRDLGVIEGGRQDGPIPAPPGGMLKITRDAWDTYWHSPLVKIIRVETDLPALRRLFEMYDQRERYIRASRGKSVVKGSTGQAILNPLLKGADALVGKIEALEDRFGFSPKARLNLGVVLGDETDHTIDDLNARLTAGEEDDSATEEDPRASALKVVRRTG